MEHVLQYADTNMFNSGFQKWWELSAKKYRTIRYLKCIRIIQKQLWSYKIATSTVDN